MAANSQALTLSREDLYELVWSKPMQQLAEDFGVSDVALAKRFKRLRIPVPGRGYWARVEAGQMPHRPKLPQREPEALDYSALTLPDPAADEGDPDGTDSSIDEGASSLPVPQEGSEVPVRSRIAGLQISFSCSLLETVPAVRRTAVQLKHPLRSELAFGRGEKSGPLVPIEVSEAVLGRALLLSDALLKAADALGWRYEAAKPAEGDTRAGERDPHHAKPGAAHTPTHCSGHLCVEGERISFRIEERLREEARVPTAAEVAREKREYGYHAPRKAAVPTGALRIVRLDGYRSYGEPTRRTWYDRKGRLVEAQIRDVLSGFYDLAVDTKARRAEEQRRAREAAEEERRRKELEERQEANTKLIEQLERDAGAWHRARFLRRYVRAVRGALSALPFSATSQKDELAQPAHEGSPAHSIRVRLGNETVDYLTWADEYIDQLDPLSPIERSAAFEARHSTYFRAGDEQAKASLGWLAEIGRRLGRSVLTTRRSPNLQLVTGCMATARNRSLR